MANIVYNPYATLGLKQTASNQEIRLALKKMVSLYCGNDENRKNGDGEYLKAIFYKAASDLLDSNKRKEIDTEIEKSKLLPSTEKCDDSKESACDKVINKPNVKIREPEKKVTTVTSSKDDKNKKLTPEMVEKKVSQIVIGRINSSYFEELDYGKISFVHKKEKVGNLYAVFQKDGYFTFTKTDYVGKTKYKLASDGNYYKYNVYSLFDCVSGRNILGEYTGYTFDDELGMPWDDGDVFDVNGVGTITCVAERFIPLKVISDSGFVSIKNLKILNDAISNLIVCKPDYVRALFANRKETVRVKEKGYYY